jgi:hypothetical protein
VEKLKEAYKTWELSAPHTPKLARFTIGIRLGTSIIESAEAAITAGILESKEKLPFIRRASAKTDIALFFAQTLWEMGALKERPFIALSGHLIEVAKMLGGWAGHIRRQNSPDVEKQSREK